VKVAKLSRTKFDTDGRSIQRHSIGLLKHWHGAAGLLLLHRTNLHVVHTSIQTADYGMFLRCHGFHGGENASYDPA